MTLAILEPPARVQPDARFALPLRESRLADTGALASLAVVWVLLSAVVNPIGDFPLNDDWSFGRSVYHLVEEGRFELVGWMSMTFVAQLFWGALFCLPAGFSFTALRLSTLTAGLVGVFALYLLLRDAHVRRGPAFLAGLILVANPVYFHLSHTFMTDVPFVAISVVALLFFARALRGGSRRDLIFGTFVACVATLIRQLGIAVPVGFAVATLVLNPTSRKNTRLAVWPVMAVGGVLVIYNICLARWHGVPALYHLPFSNVQQMAAENGVMTVGVALIHAATAFFYVGLFTLPFTIAVLPTFAATQDRQRRRVAVAAALPAMVVFSLAGLTGFFGLPLIGNILHARGLGPLSLRDSYLLGNHPWPAVPWFREGVALAGALGVAVLLCVLLSGRNAWVNRTGRQPTSNERVAVFALAVGVVYLAPLTLGGFYDRYLLLLLPLVLLAVSPFVSEAEEVHRRSSGLRLGGALTGVAFLILYGAIAIAGTHDYLAWNRARWQAVRWLIEEQNISPTRIDGGAEVNGWYLYQPDYEPSCAKSWWWVDDDEYVLAFGSLEGYQETREVSFTQWFPPGRGKVVVLHRGDP